MEIKTHIKECCAEKNLIFDEMNDVYKVSPGVYVFHAYNKDAQRRERYKCVDTDGTCMIELY